MLAVIFLAAVWAVFLLRMALAQNRYYQAIRETEPEVWQQARPLQFGKTPIIYVSARGTHLFNEITNDTVVLLKRHCKKTHRHFLFYVIFVLASLLVYLSVS